ncbi:uncharacterized protein LOC123540538 [Mercenaria mercenaria]|uniref:uncharacterized protein LOC123540538 n=1 Tax=Mercenaria mercenaria TaxID=6596 RepID=UPI00234EB17B|nr:uncharacterized protein LOC123540538 [Mercenaria mercenaria]XP_045181566.2 uncharacterized protein LOC123540538 [Mercenaria mercenaria]
MAHDPDYYTYMSLCMSEILYDIGLNEDMVIKERRKSLLRESVTTLGHRLGGVQQTNYIFGSQSEASTTYGLRSDSDNLICLDSWKAVTDLKDCKPGEVNNLIIDDMSTPPGYCLLLRMQGDVPLNLQEHKTSKTFLWQPNDDYKHELHGPAISVKGRNGYDDQDYVYAFHCQTWPLSAREWLTDKGRGKWPTKEMKSFAEKSGCFLVGVGSKDSAMEEYEWRISMSQAERSLMFSLNITQIRCYVLMKMVNKTFINPIGDGIITSYMCKTVLFHCIKHSYSNLWQESKLLYCLTLCLSALQYCVLIGNCPHFIIHENNLMEGRITTEFRTMFLTHMHRIKVDIGLSLKVIAYDSLGLRLERKMKRNPRNTIIL